MNKSIYYSFEDAEGPFGADSKPTQEWITKNVKIGNGKKMQRVSIMSSVENFEHEQEIFGDTADTPLLENPINEYKVFEGIDNTESPSKENPLVRENAAPFASSTRPITDNLRFQGSSTCLTKSKISFHDQFFKDSEEQTTSLFTTNSQVGDVESEKSRNNFFLPSSKQAADGSKDKLIEEDKENNSVYQKFLNLTTNLTKSISNFNSTSHISLIEDFSSGPHSKLSTIQEEINQDEMNQHQTFEKTMKDPACINGSELKPFVAPKFSIPTLKTVRETLKKLCKLDELNEYEKDEDNDKVVEDLDLNNIKSQTLQGSRRNLPSNFQDISFHYLPKNGSIQNLQPSGFSINFNYTPGSFSDLVNSSSSGNVSSYFPGRVIQAKENAHNRNDNQEFDNDDANIPIEDLYNVEPRKFSQSYQPRNLSNVSILPIINSQATLGSLTASQVNLIESQSNEDSDDLRDQSNERYDPYEYCKNSVKRISNETKAKELWNNSFVFDEENHYYRPYYSLNKKQKQLSKNRTQRLLEARSQSHHRSLAPSKLNLASSSKSEPSRLWSTSRIQTTPVAVTIVSNNDRFTTSSRSRIQLTRPASVRSVFSSHKSFTGNNKSSRNYIRENIESINGKLKKLTEVFKMPNQEKPPKPNRPGTSTGNILQAKKIVPTVMKKKVVRNPSLIVPLTQTSSTKASGSASFASSPAKVIGKKDSSSSTKKIGVNSPGFSASATKNIDSSAELVPVTLKSKVKRPAKKAPIKPKKENLDPFYLQASSSEKAIIDELVRADLEAVLNRRKEAEALKLSEEIELKSNEVPHRKLGSTKVSQSNEEYGPNPHAIQSAPLPRGNKAGPSSAKAKRPGTANNKMNEPSSNTDIVMKGLSTAKKTPKSKISKPRDNK